MIHMTETKTRRLGKFIYVDNVGKDSNDTQTIQKLMGFDYI